MVRIMAVADEVDPSLNRDAVAAARPDVIVSCGDLPFDHLEYLVTLANVPLLFVPGNHDPDVRSPRRALSVPPAGVPALVPAMPWRAPGGVDDTTSAGPAGWSSLDGAIVEVAALRIG